MIEQSEQINELAAALVAFQAEVPAIPKTATNPFFRSKYADLADVKAVADPIATNHKLCVTQWPSSNDKGDTLVTQLLHASGQFIRSEMDLHPVKNDPQAQGSALTYGRRYAYMAALGLVADQDDDGNAASKRTAATSPVTKASAIQDSKGAQPTQNRNVRKPPTKSTQNIVEKLEATFTPASEGMRRSLLNRASREGLDDTALSELMQTNVHKEIDDANLSVDDVNKLLALLADKERPF